MTASVFDRRIDSKFDHKKQKWCVSFEIDGEPQVSEHRILHHAKQAAFHRMALATRRKLAAVPMLNRAALARTVTASVFDDEPTGPEAA